MSQRLRHERAAIQQKSKWRLAGFIIGSGSSFAVAKMGEVEAGAWLRDWEQVHLEGRKESLAELRDDKAGIAVGQAMAKTTAAGKSGNYADLAKQIMDILCL